MYSFIALADLHIGWKLFNLPELAQDIKENFVKALDIALAKKVNYIFIVGDLFDINKPSPDLIEFVAEQVKRMAANGIVVAGIAGDHDKPVNGSTWVHLTGILPINDISPSFVGYDYSDNSQENIDKLAAIEDKSEIEWIFLHGQVPELFSYTEDKKKLDIKSLDVMNTFPALKGIVLGDIHTPIDGVLSDPAQVRKDEPWIGYCGSLSIIKTDEIGTKEGILYWDGSKLSRIPFQLDRQFISLDIATSVKPINWIEKYKRFFQDNTGKKPVFVISYDKQSQKSLVEAGPLYEVGIVKTIKTKKYNDVKEVINIRSELKTNNRIEATLKDAAQEQEVYDLILATLNSDDPKAVLDKFKQETLNPCKSHSSVKLPLISSIS